MKKTLLTFAAALTFGATFAQDTTIVFNGTWDEVSNGNPYAFEASQPLKVKLDTALGNVFLHLSTTTPTTGYAGGGGAAGYDVHGNPVESLGFNGTVADSWFQFAVSAPGTTPRLQFQFKTVDGDVFGYEWNFADSSKVQTGYQVISTPVSKFKLKSKSGAFDSTVVTDDQLQSATSEFQFIVSYTGPATTILLDNIYFINAAITTGLDDVTLTSDFIVYPNPNNTGVINLGENAKSYSLSTISGAVMKEGVGNTINVEGLEKGIYFVRVGNKTTKVVLN